MVDDAGQEAIRHRDLCELYRTRDRLDDALLHGRLATALAPDDAETHYNLGLLHYDRMEIEDSIRHERRALRLAPGHAGAHFELAEALLLSGRFEEGWQEYEHRFDLPGAPRLLPETNDRPQWDGRPMPDGTLLLIGDQGFGDTIQFCRYIPLVAKLCHRLVAAASAEMRPLIRQQTGIAACSDRWQDLPPFDAYCPLSGLPRLFHTDLGNIPARIPYLRADADRMRWWRRRIDQLLPKGPRRIAIVWAGRPTHGNDGRRTIRLGTLTKALADRPDVALISLQKGPAQNEIGGYFGNAPLVNLGPEINDFADTMAVLACTERLVSVDTSVAHLAGAMGHPVSLLLPFAPDWRWLTGRDDSPWYPTVTLCRQEVPGDWLGATDKMRRMLDVRPVF